MSGRHYSSGMPRVLVVADTEWVRDGVHSALSEPGFDLTDHDEPATVATRAADEDADAVVIDFQVKSMGGMAITRSLRERASLSGTAPPATILLLDRAADAFLARRAGAHAWVRKPIGATELRTAIGEAMETAAAEGVEEA